VKLLGRKCGAAIMVLPTIITISEDAMRNTPRHERSEFSFSIPLANDYKVVTPYSASGIQPVLF
jgi:phosphate transport system permease protein